MRVLQNVSQSVALGALILLGAELKRFTCVLVILIHAILGSTECHALGCFQGGCDVVWHMNKRFDDGLRSKSENLVGPAKQAFIEAMDVLFDEKMKRLIAQIDAAAAGRLDQFDSTVKTAIAGIDAIIAHAEATASKLVNQTTEQIRTQIIETTFSQADALTNTIAAKISEILGDLDCKIDGQREKLIEFWVSLVSIPNPLNHCYREYGAAIFAPRWDDYITKYRIQECVYNDDLTASTTVRQIIDKYARLLQLNRRFACISNATPEALLILGRDGARYRQEFNVWWMMSEPAK